MRTVVLVHGLYHRPEHFDRVTGLLRAGGVEVLVPELHRGSLAADTAAVQAVVDALPEPPLLLGHSYGGSVITGVRGAGRLVYLAAFVPDVGESAAALSATSPSRLQEAVRAEPDGSTTLRPDLAADLLYQDSPAPLAAWAVGLLRAQAPGCGRGVPLHHGWKDTAATYVVCGRDRVLAPALQRRMATRCTDVREWPVDHSPFVGEPGLLAELLRELLAGGVPRG